MSLFKRKEMLTARIPNGLMKDIKEIASFNGVDRTTQIEKFLIEGVEKSKKNLGSMVFSFNMLVFSFTLSVFYMWYLLKFSILM